MRRQCCLALSSPGGGSSRWNDSLYISERVHVVYNMLSAPTIALGQEILNPLYDIAVQHPLLFLLGVIVCASCCLKWYLAPGGPSSYNHLIRLERAALRPWPQPSLFVLPRWWRRPPLEAGGRAQQERTRRDQAERGRGEKEKGEAVCSLHFCIGRVPHALQVSVSGSTMTKGRSSCAGRCPK